ncbi:MAG: prepilin peptidase [Eubacterium sp.]|nr:prepilin peptidase [Eubacterium sp.]
MKTADWTGLVILGCNALQDIRKREIFLIPTLAAAAAGTVWMIQSGQLNAGGFLMAVLPGMLLMLMALATAGEVGFGDGIVLLAAGIWGGFPQILYIAAGGVFLSAAVSGVLLISRSRVRSIPMVPFFLAAAVLYLSGR